MLILSAALLSIGTGFFKDWLKIKIPKYYAFIGALLFLVGAIISYSINHGKSKNHTSSEKISKPLFDSTDRRFKILVLPFDKECDYNGAKYDIGRVISKRLENLNKQDTLNLITFYLIDSIDFSNFNSETADSIRKYHHADQIVYGSYSFKECEGNTSDKICFNYRTDSTKWRLGREMKTDYKMSNMSGLDALRNGFGQDGIDYIIYSLAGFSAMNERNFFRALKMFQRIKKYNEDAEIGISMGICYHELDDLTSSKKTLENVLKINLHHSMAWNNLGVVYSELKIYSKEKMCYEKSIRFDSTNDLAWYNLGVYYKTIKNYYLSRDYLKQSLKINPNHYLVWGNLGNVLCDLKDTSNALKCYEESLKLNPFDTVATNNIIGIFVSQNNYKKAKEFLEKLLTFNPNNGHALAMLSDISYSLNNYSKAKEYAERALKINPNDAMAWNCLGGVYFDSMFYDRARACYEKSIQNNSKNKEHWANLGNACYHLKDFACAKESFLESLKIDPEYYESLRGLGFIYFDSQEYKQAEKLFKKAIKINPLSYFAIYNLAALYSTEKNKNETLIYLKKAISADSSCKLLAIKDKDFYWLWNDKQFIEVTQ